MKKLLKKSSSRKKRRSYTSNIPRYSVDVHVSTNGTQRSRKRK